MPKIQRNKGGMFMPHTIAVAGKGGVGKTTTCGMLIDYLTAKGKGPVLVKKRQSPEVSTSGGCFSRDINCDLSGS